jgi:hypothetical protein
MRSYLTTQIYFWGAYRNTNPGDSLWPGKILWNDFVQETGHSIRPEAAVLRIDCGFSEKQDI